jgi:aminopeptidase YwaD
MSESFDWPELEHRLRQHVATLASTPRPPGSSAHRQAREYIRAHLNQAGFATEEVTYRTSLVPEPGTNVLTRPVPDRPELPLMIVGAHYDSLAETPGADDNASAVAALLELARWLGPVLRSEEGWQARLQLAAYDQEESGLFGSGHHSRQVHGPLRGMISLEMLGYTDHRPGSQHLPERLAGLYPDVGNFIGVVGNDASLALLEAVTKGLRQIEGLPVECLAVPGDGQLIAESRLSDHASFWDRRQPALMLTDTSFFRNPHYHMCTDTPDTLDYPFLARVTAGVCVAVRDLLRS